MSIPAGSRLALLLALTLGVGPGLAACAAPADDDGAASSEDALTSLPAGHYALTRAPLRGSYVKSLTLLPGKKFELEFVRVRETTKPWIWNPWIPVPSREEETYAFHGTYLIYESDGTRISFDPVDTGAFSIGAGLSIANGELTLTPDQGDAYVLESAAAPVDATKPLVASCTAGSWEGTLRFDAAGRRRGSLRVDKRLASADSGNPNVATFPIAFVGGTGVEDYMAFEGEDRGNNRIEFAVKKSVLEGARAGATFQLGLGYQREYTSYYVHQTVRCTVTR